MKKKFVLLLIVLSSANFAFTQCDNFPYFINEVISPANEAYYNLIEFERLCINISDSANIVIMQAEIKNANELLSTVKANLDFVDVAIQNARTNAENCYCVNGQKSIYKIEEQYDKTEFYLNKALKLVKLSLKTKDIALVKQYFNAALSYSLEAKKAVDEVVNAASDAMDSCN